jgi:hypothetical protein
MSTVERSDPRTGIALLTLGEAVTAFLEKRPARFGST